jgi:hypothetical protein
MPQDHYGHGAGPCRRKVGSRGKDGQECRFRAFRRLIMCRAAANTRCFRWFSRDSGLCVRIADSGLSIEDVALDPHPRGEWPMGEIQSIEVP